MLDINSKVYENLSGRDLYSKVFLEIGKQNKDVFMLGSDTTRSNGGGEFLDAFPERSLDLGIAEQNTISFGAGLAKRGKKIPLIGIFGFLVLRAAEQIKLDVCYQNLNVKIFGSHPGAFFATGGVTHHGINDISVLRIFPNLTIIQPASPKEAIAAISTAILDHVGPVYLRLPTSLGAELYDDTYHFEIGKAYTLQEGKDIAILSSGATMSIAKEATDQLKKEGIGVRLINIPTIKPIDRDTIIKAARETGGIITIEDNDIAGGIGMEVCYIVSENCPTKVKVFAFPKDRFTVVAPSEKVLLDHYGINVEKVKEAAKEMLAV